MGGRASAISIRQFLPNGTRCCIKCSNLSPAVGILHGRSVVNVTKAIAYNWRDDLPQIISSLRQNGISIEDFFKLERTVTFKLSALLGDANELHKIIVNPSVDISGFVGKDEPRVPPQCSLSSGGIRDAAHDIEEDPCGWPCQL